MKRIITLIALAVSLSSYADTCPPVQSLNFNHPPPGWSVILHMPPIGSDPYYFGAAVHSFNGGFYFKHIICAYETCPGLYCERYEIVSNQAYQYPLFEKVKPWDARPSMQDTIVCRPPDNDPAHCVFQ